MDYLTKLGAPFGVEVLLAPAPIDFCSRLKSERVLDFCLVCPGDLDQETLSTKTLGNLLASTEESSVPIEFLDFVVHFLGCGCHFGGPKVWLSLLLFHLLSRKREARPSRSRHREFARSMPSKLQAYRLVRQAMHAAVGNA